LPKRFERQGPKSVSPATYCSGVEVVVWCVHDVPFESDARATSYHNNGLPKELRFTVDGRGIVTMLIVPPIRLVVMKTDVQSW